MIFLGVFKIFTAWTPLFPPIPGAPGHRMALAAPEPPPRFLAPETLPVVSATVVADLIVLPLGSVVLEEEVDRVTAGAQGLTEALFIRAEE
jgi:hypothetical protein